MSNLPIRIAALYQFARFDDPKTLRAPLLALCEANGVRGTLLLAREGINGTIAGSDSGVEAVLDHIRTLPGCDAIEVKESRAEGLPFHRTKVRLKKEIVTMGQPDLDPLAGVGTYVAPEDWNALISDPDTIVIDTRNDYEVQIGSFEGAIDPQTTSFREFPEWFRAKRAELEAEGRSPKIAMFCTGGSAAKSTAFARAEGVDEVYHLRRHPQLSRTRAREEAWRGECCLRRTGQRQPRTGGGHHGSAACRRPLTKPTWRMPFARACPARVADERSDEQRAHAERTVRRGSQRAAKNTSAGARSKRDG